MEYKLLSGEILDLSSLSKADLEFLFDLSQRAMNDEGHYTIQLAVSGSGAYPFNGSKRVTREIHESPLYRAAEDIAARASIRQGAMAPDPGDEPVLTEEIIGVSDAARILGISRAAVVNAAHAGRIRGARIGKSWALLKRSVERYEVAQHRVEAGRAAHQ